MSKNTTLPILLVILAAGLGLADEIDIQKPLGGSTVTETAFEVRLDEDVDPSSIAVEVNGVSLPDSAFSIEGGVLQGAMEGSALEGGSFNSLSISARRLSDGLSLSSSSNFLWFELDEVEVEETFDFSSLINSLGDILPSMGKTAPELSIESPTAGTFFAPGSIFQVTGKVEDAEGLTDLLVSIDGAVAESRLSTWDPVTGTYAIDVSFTQIGLHRINVIANNVNGGRSSEKVSVFVGESRASNHLIENASQVLLTDHGMHQIGNMVEPALAPAELFKDILTGQSIWKGKAAFSKGEMWLSALGHQGIDLELGIQSGLLRVKAEVKQLQVRSHLEAKTLFIKTTANPVVTTQRSVWEAYVRIQKSAGKGVDLVLQSDQLQIDGLQGKIPGLPDALVGAAISALEDYLIETVQASLGEVVLEDLEKKLNGYFMMVNGPHTTDLLGARVSVDGELTSIEVAGDIGRFHSNSCVMALDRPVESDQNGWFTTPNNGHQHLPALRDMTIAISDDILNAGLHEAWRSGAMHLDLSAMLAASSGGMGFTLGDLGNDLESGEEESGGVDLASILSLASDLPVAIEMRPMLSPILLMGYEGNDLTVKAHDVFVDLYLVLEETRQLLFSFALDLEVPLNEWFYSKEAGMLKFQPGEMDMGFEAGENFRLDFSVESMPLVTIPFGGSFTGLITQIAHIALPFLLEIISDSSVAILSDLPMTNVLIWGEQDNLMLSGNLEAGNADNGGDLLFADGFDEDDTEEGVAFSFCGMVALFGGTGGDFLLNAYRGFRDDVLRQTPGGDGGISAYYRYSIVAAAAVQAVPALRPLAVATFWTIGLFLVLALYTDGFFFAWCALVALFLVRHRAERWVARVIDHHRGSISCPSLCSAWA